MISKRIIGFILFSLPFFSLSGQSIVEKKANLKPSESDLEREAELLLQQTNQETLEIHARIQHLYNEVAALYESHAPSEEYQALLKQINDEKRRLVELEQAWRELAVQGNRMEGYGLWHAPETTLEQLVIDYGSQDYVYLIPPEVGNMKLSIDSNLPIPRASWNEMLELILDQNGVGIRNLNPYLRQLYLVKHNHAHLKLITNCRRDLEVLPPSVRVSFFLSPEPSEVRRTFAFLEKFINPSTTSLQVVGRDILLISSVGEVQDLLKLYDFIAANKGEKDYRLLPVKLPPDEMAKILDAVFDQAGTPIATSSPTTMPAMGSAGKLPPPRPPTFSSTNESNGLKVMALKNMAQALFVVGTREEIRKAEEIVRNVESQVGGIREKVIFWYTVKHSEPEELADILYRVYSLMMVTSVTTEKIQGGERPESAPPVPNEEGVAMFAPPPQREPPPTLYQPEGFYQEGGYIVNPAPAQPRPVPPPAKNGNRDNFIVDPKTGAIVMVVEADLLPKIKDLLRKLDVSKKMVHIETLLFEKILNRENSFGLNVLKIGEAALNKNATGAFFNHLFPKGSKQAVRANMGVTEFFFSRKGSDCGIPAFDLAYRFLLNQDDVQINSNPSLLTVNQTPATIAINEDISINTGVFEVETAKGVTLKDAFTRAQYGITISIKPAIHLAQCDAESDEYDYVTLETDITFDTIHPSGHSERPNVTRRHITNQVQVPDGETVILGGLRRKVSHDSREAIPFLGELPGLGKLFSMNALRESNTDMFIFITPRIVKDPKEQLVALRQELLTLRPGDLPYFLECVEEAHRYDKTRLMEGSMTMLFGKPRAHYYVIDDPASGEYDGS